MRYDYSCSICEHIQEEVHGYQEKPRIKCENCGYKCIKLISGDVRFNGVDGTGSMYDFVDTNTTGKPIRFQSKKAWKNHLKSRGLTDDIKQGNYTEKDLMKTTPGKSKEQKRKEYKESVVKVLKEKGILQKYGK